MVSIPLGYSSFVRAVAEEAPIPLENRYFEQTPANQNEQAALISRPGFRKWLTISGSPIDNIFYQPGSFSDSMFVASGGSLYRVFLDETVTTLGSSLFNTSFGTAGRTTVKMTATAQIGTTPAYLFAADGKYLWLYADAAPSRGSFVIGANPSNGNSVRIDNTYYIFTTGSVDAGTPDGTSGNPWLVKIGATATATLTNFRNAVNDSGVGGVDYSTATVAHSSVIAFNNSSTTMRIYSKAFTSAGDSIVLDQVGTLTRSAPTLTGGGTPGVSQVYVPDDLGVIDVTFVAGYIIVIVGEGYGANGRFYWLDPGTVVIDSLNFATAERTADPLYGVKTIDDQFWLFGNNTTEIWYPTGDFATPFQRLAGKVFNGGIWPGSDVKVRDYVMVIDPTGVVYAIGGGSKRVSDFAVEEQIRRSIASQRINGTVLRTWSFSMDGHDFYVIYLPGQATLVFDVTTETWASWKSNSLAYLNQHVGMNWTSAGSVTYGHTQLSNVVAGDLRSGQLWLAEPTLGYDQNITTGAVEAFTCKVMGGLSARGRENTNCGLLKLTAAKGAPKVTGAGVTLRTSDDAGQTWTTQDTIVVTAGDYISDFTWRSLGRIKPPGKLFEITDAGATIRIDGLDMN
jgi:hypothetical protein